MAGVILRGGPAGRCLAWAAIAPIAFGQLAYAQPAPPPPLAQTPPAAAAPPVVLAPAPVVLPPLSPAEQAIALRVLAAAGLHGLDSKAYLPAGAIDGSELTPEQAAALSAGVLAYARDVRTGRMENAEFPAMWALRPAPYDPAPDMLAALSTNRLQAWLDSLPPRYSGYAAMKRGLARYRDIAAKGGWKPLAGGKPMGLGSADPRVAALRIRLAAEDDLLAAQGPAVFDLPLQEAVQRAQRRFGLKPDGVVGPGMLAHLNRPVGERVLQIIANMERWRWLPQTMPATRVQVNSGAAIVTLFRDDKPVLSMKAVSGRPGDETPMLSSAIHSVVINPPWNVPSGIAERELWPKEKAHPGYLAANGYRIIQVEGAPPRLQQASGDQSALGRFKFDFDNPFAVYLHDTPSRGGFDNFARQASHGCVRVEKPRALAEALLEADPNWAPDVIEAKLAVPEKTVRAPLQVKMPVFILYWTAFAGADGAMHFRTDPYGWDRQLLQLTGVLPTPPAPAPIKDKGSKDV